MTRLAEGHARVVGILFSVLVLLLLVGIHFLGTKCSPLGADGQQAVGVAWLHDSNTIIQQVHASHNGLSQTSFRLDRVPAGGLYLRMQDAEEEGSAQDSWSTMVSGGGGLFTLSFPRQQDSAGREYTLLLQAPSAEVSQRTSLQVYADDLISGELLLNGRPTGGDLALRLCYRPTSLRERRDYLVEEFWDHYSDLDQLLNRLSQYKPFYYKRTQWIGLLVLNAVALSWLGAVLWGQTFHRSPWTMKRSLRVALQLDLLALGILAIFGLWSGKLEPATELNAEYTAGAIDFPSDGTLLYDFAFGALSDQNAHVDSPENWYVSYDWISIGDDSRPVLRMHPPSNVSYDLVLPDNARLRGAAAVDPDVWSPDKGDGVLFQIQVFGEEGDETVYYQEVDPKSQPDDRRWHTFEVDLSPFAGQRVTIKFLTYPLDSNDWDWAVWGAPVLVAN